MAYWRTKFCMEFGWRFEEFDRISVLQFQETIGVWEGMAKAERAGR